MVFDVHHVAFTRENFAGSGPIAVLRVMVPAVPGRLARDGMAAWSFSLGVSDVPTVWLMPGALSQVMSRALPDCRVATGGRLPGSAGII